MIFFNVFLTIHWKRYYEEINYDKPLNNLLFLLSAPTVQRVNGHYIFLVNIDITTPQRLTGLTST